MARFLAGGKSCGWTSASRAWIIRRITPERIRWDVFVPLVFCCPPNERVCSRNVKTQAHVTDGRRDARAFTSVPAAKEFAVPHGSSSRFRLRLPSALRIHLWARKDQLRVETRSYSIFLGILLGVGNCGALPCNLSGPVYGVGSTHVPHFRRGDLLLTVWEVITSGFRLLPLPYFPEPGGGAAESDKRSRTPV